MNAERRQELLNKFADARVLVVGDVYVDEYVYGEVTGVSLEAPIPIFEVHERRYNPGAAGNAACNVAALGATTYIVGVVGADTNADIARREFAARHVDASGLVVDASCPTNTYGKLLAGGYNIPGQEVLRTDTPTPPPVSGAVEAALVEQIRARAKDVDAIVVVDQVGSVVTEAVIDAVVQAAHKHHLITVGDSRSSAHRFVGLDVVVPNDREAGLATGIDVVDDATLAEAGARLLQSAKSALITRGPLGIAVFEPHQPARTVPVPPCKVIDVTGAGDTVTAAAAVSLVAGATLDEAAEIGNAAASVAVAQRGVVTVTREEVAQVLLQGHGLTKAQSRKKIAETVRKLQAEGKRVVWTNGCFDIVHIGHITYLQRAARLGDVLVVGLNSDASVKKLKGPDRPIIDEQERALVLSALECIDYVTVFEETSPLAIIEEIKPDIYAKGGDYTIDTIDQDERHVVESYGGEIAILPVVEGRSTTSIIGRIAKNHG
jgi:D-beta-D-heptose 7-phosphate kinase/D-beta-D-heptose 1-phosphate adenosyltransferase